MTTRLADPGALARHRQALVADREPGRAVIAVCGGTGCRAQGAMEVLEALRTELGARGVDREVELRATGCHGFCERGPLVLALPGGRPLPARAC